MIIDKKTNMISGLVPDDIGKPVIGVLITCRKIIYQQAGRTFQAFAADNGISCSMKNALQVKEGFTYKAAGKITEYRGAPQFEITAIEEVKDEGYEDNVRVNFLIGFFEDLGVTKRMAEKIVGTFGEKTFDKLMNSPGDAALAVKGLSKAKADKIGEELVINEKGYRRYLALMMAGLSAKQAKICDREHGITPEDIDKNPFCLTVIDSFSFEDCDAIAKGKDIDPLDKDRIYGAVRSVLNRLHTNNSSTYFAAAEVENEVRKLIIPKDAGKDIISVFPSAFEAVCEYAVNERGTVSIYRFADNKCIGCSVRDDGARLALSQYFKAEATIKKEIERFVKAKYNKPKDEVLDKTVRSLAEQFGICLDEKQTEAVKLCMYSPVSVITGGPGTGKTTIMGLLAEHFRTNNISCAFAAPTGRAAKRLSEATGAEAYTIHRLLEAVGDPDSENGFFFRKGPGDPVKARVIVVDEMSMVDTLLFKDLLRAVDKGTSVIFIGDPDQLPSVGCGNVLSDLLSCRSIPCVKLDIIHRQAEGGDIPSNAVRILEGNAPVPGPDFRVISCVDDKEALAKIGEIYDDLSGREDADVIVLSPTKQPQNPLGTAGINAMLQARTHDAGEVLQLASSGFYKYLAGDKVMQIKNNYSLEYFDPVKNCTGEGVYNGEIGVITEIDEGAAKIRVLFEDGKLVSYGNAELDNIDLAYAVTVHKSQGCEFNDCIIVLGKMNRLLYRRDILYTAVTRGKRSVTVIDTDNTLKGFLSSSAGNSRKTSLKDLFAIIDHKMK